ncbi:chitin synthase 2 [Halenospora varia]|nr:chitin synthase 2 [Halenospora varia]
MNPQYDSNGRVRSTHIPMPVPHDPEDPLLYNRPSYTDLHHQGGGYQAPHYDDPRHDYDLDPEDRYPDPYQAGPQDIPLLNRNPSQEQYYDPHDSRPDLGHRASHQTFHGSFADAGAEQAGDRGTPWNGGFRETQNKNYHLIYDCPVPPKLLKHIEHKPDDRELTHMRYTAATCDPADFVYENFQLRPQLYKQKRETELFIVITMYNEEDILFGRTMAGVIKNIEYMCSLKGKHKGLWDENGWKKIIVCIVVDGRAKLNIRTRAVLTAMGVYQHGVGVERVNDQPVTAHIYEYTTKVNLKIKGPVVETVPGGGPPVQIIFCLKEKNQKKINSHRWALQAFGESLKPNVVVLLDAGTKPGKTSVYELWKAFELDKNCGGACGEIKAQLGEGKYWEKLINPIIAAQNFEYKMSNILDKPMESAFGFISVLPGAFSAYRFIALQNDVPGPKGKGPLEKYFDGEKHHLDADIFTKNMYLAEDRILCFELVAKRKSNWVLTYVCTASGETDVPDEMPELIKQRRRWLNGSFFAAVYALAHFYQIFRSSHSMLRKIMFLVEFLYQLISMIFSWFAVGNFFLVFHILTTALGGPLLLGKFGSILSVVTEWIYLASLVICFVLSLGNTPDGSRKFYITMVYSWGLIMVYLLFASVYITVKSVQSELNQGDKKFTLSDIFTNTLFFTLIVSLLSTYLLWIFISIVFLDPWHIVSSSLQYLLLSPTYTNVINVYAFCNTHDVTWGTKGDDKAEKLGTATVGKDGKSDSDITFENLDGLYDEALQKFAAADVKTPSAPNAADEELNYNKAFRSYVVLAWMFCNAALVAVVLKSGGLNRLSVKPVAIGKDDQSRTVKVYLLIVLWSVAGLSFFKFVGAMWYKIKRIFVR